MIKKQKRIKSFPKVMYNNYIHMDDILSIIVYFLIF